MSRSVRLRQLWWSVHRWIGIGLMILLVPIAISGALLVYHDEFDALFNPKRWAVTGAQLSFSRRNTSPMHRRRLTPNEQAIGIRYPREPGTRCRCLARQEADPESARRPRLIRSSRPADRRRARQGRFPRLAVRVHARFPRKPDGPAILRAPDRRLGRRRDADPVADRHLALVAAPGNAVARLALAARAARRRQICTICSASGFRFRSRSSR